MVSKTPSFLKLNAKTLPGPLFRQLVAIERSCGLEPYTPKMLLECVRDMDTYVWLDGDTVAGFITVHPSTRYLGGGIYIVNLNVAEAYRRKGIGSRLIRAAAACYAATHAGQLVSLDVAKDNQAALELYKSLGFSVTDLPSGNGDTDWVMTVPLEALLKENQLP